MTDNIMEAGSSVEEIIAMPGLNLIITPDKQYESYSALNISLAIADVAGFLKRETEHSRVLVFSLGNVRKTLEHMIDRYNVTIGDITVVHAYQKGTFGNRIDEGLNVFLRDNPQLKFIVIDSIEKIVEGEIGQMKYNFVYNKLCALKEVASKHGATLLTATYTGASEDSDKLVDVADTVLEVIKGGSQSGEEYTLCISGKNISKTQMAVEFGVGKCRWHQVTVR